MERTFHPRFLLRFLLRQFPLRNSQPKPQVPLRWLLLVIFQSRLQVPRLLVLRLQLVLVLLTFLNLQTREFLLKSVVFLRRPLVDLPLRFLDLLLRLQDFLVRARTFKVTRIGDIAQTDTSTQAFAQQTAWNG